MQDDLNTAAALGAMFELVRALNSAIDAGELGTGDVPAIRAGVRRLRSRARRAVAAARGRRAAAGAGRGDRAADRGAPAPPGAAATSRPPTASATIWRRAASCSKTRRPARAGSGSRSGRTPHADARDRRRFRPEGQGDHRARRRASSRRPTRAAIRSSSSAAPARCVEDVDGNVFLDCAAGIAVNCDRPLASRRRARHHRAGAAVPAHVGHRLLLRAAGAPGRGAGGDRADRRRRAVVFRQLRHRGDRGVHQAGALRDRPPEHHRVSSAAFHGRTMGALCADGEQGGPAPRLRPVHARRVSCAVCRLLPLSASV